MQKCTLALGCFWKPEAIFRQISGVLSTAVGYTGGTSKAPSYEQVCSGITGHAEAVQIEYDSHQISYEELLEVFWQCHDPTQLNRQGWDIGTQYRSAIFTHGPEQVEAAKQSIKQLYASGKISGNITTEVSPAKEFWIAEDYHQQYLAKNPNGYCGISGIGKIFPCK